LANILEMKTYPRLFVLILILISCSPRPEEKDPKISPDEIQRIIQSATSRIRAGAADTGIQLLDSLVTVGHSEYEIWSGLGMGYRRKQEHDKSIEAYHKALELKPGDGPAMYNLGLAYALSGDKDNAFEWLIKAKQSNSFNVLAFAANPIAQNYQDDPRLPDLFPTQAEYGDPFAEPTKILHDLRGENQRDQFGWIARRIGDVDGDNVNDLVTNAPTYKVDGQQVGKVYVYSGKTGELIWSQTGKEENGWLGFDLEGAGDINQDGTPDVIAGAPYVNKVYVYSGGDGQLLLEISGSDPRGAFGTGVKGVGDHNGDGQGDLLISEPYQVFGSPINSDSIVHPGKAHLHSGKDGSLLKTWEGSERGDAFGSAVAGNHEFLIIGAPNAGKGNRGLTYVYQGIADQPSFVIEPDTTGNSLGSMFLSVVGDIDADGIGDIYASDWMDGGKGRATGRIYVHSGADGRRLLTLSGEAAGDGFGIGVADGGDLNKDGTDDLIIGAWQHAGKSPSGGKVYLYSGKDGSLIRAITGKVMGETFGFDATNLGDVNADGSIDLLITSAWSSVNGFQSGRVYVISGEY